MIYSIIILVTVMMKCLNESGLIFIRNPLNLSESDVMLFLTGASGNVLTVTICVIPANVMVFPRK